MTERIKNSEKLYSVEFVRFIFAAVIVYYHILHSNIKGAAIDLRYTKGSMITVHLQVRQLNAFLLFRVISFINLFSADRIFPFLNLHIINLHAFGLFLQCFCL